ncbi:hypothetical protein SBBP2_250024 [Burkholderiales bacterium]|nr:hypothetical protein SBBP2_250024 [Burkholderiales bacterium]
MNARRAHGTLERGGFDDFRSRVGPACARGGRRRPHAATSAAGARPGARSCPGAAACVFVR